MLNQIKLILLKRVFLQFLVKADANVPKTNLKLLFPRVMVCFDYMQQLC